MTDVIDVNAEFAAEQKERIEIGKEQGARFQAMIDSGEMVAVPGRPNAFRVTTGWDASEYITLQDGQFIPQHNLDEITDANGGKRAALYTAVPTWHLAEGVGLVPGGTTDIDQILNLGGINWLVLQEPQTFTPKSASGKLGDLTVVPDSFVNYRSDTFAPLGTVGKRYEPVQPHQQFAFLQEIAERNDIPFESAGSLRGGKRVFVSMRVPEGITIDAEGINEKIELFFAALNDNTGNGKLNVVVSPWRPVCANTNRFADRDAVSRWGVRHTKSVAARMKEAQKSLRLVFKYAKTVAEQDTKLAQTDMAVDEFREFMAGLWPEPKPGKDGKVTKRSELYVERRESKLMELWATETGRVGETRYAAYNAITGYADNEQMRRVDPANMLAAQATAVLEGSDDGLKSKAHKQLLTLGS